MKIAVVITLADPSVTEILGASDVDFLIVDMEHAPVAERELEGILISAASVQKRVLVRVAENNPFLIKRVIDIGPAGIIVPNVRTVEAARAAVSATRYPPTGTRGYGPRRADAYGHLPDFVERSNADLALVVQLEDISAVPVAGDIVRVPGVDGVMIGPNDLSGSMGLLGQIEHPSVLTQVESIIDVCRREKMSVGCGGYFGAIAGRLMRRGIDWLTAGGDLWLMRRELDEVVATLRDASDAAL